MEQLKFLEGNKAKSHITISEIKKMGFMDQTTHHVETLADLKKTKPMMVLAKCLKNRNIMQEKFKSQRLHKNRTYLMGLGLYQQLRNDQTGKKLIKPNNVQFEKFYKPYEGQSLDNKNLLVIRTGGIGDLLFIQPNLIHLKEKYPTCKITIACGPQYHPMIEAWDCIDKMSLLPVPFNEIIDSDYHAIFEGVIERCNEAKNVNAYHLFTKWLNINLPDEKLIPQQTPKPDKVEEVKEILDEWKVEPGEFFLFQIRASSPLRTPRPSLWQKIIQRLIDDGKKIIITDSPYMSDQIDVFITAFKEKNKSIFNFAKVSKSLDYSIALGSMAKMVVVPDSSFIHLAQSLNIKTFGIYGAFPGKVRLSTYKNCDWIDVKHKSEDCVPCFTHGYSTCKNSTTGHPDCYDNLDIDDCYKRIKQLESK